MKYSHELMTDPTIQQKKIGNLKRSTRNSWAESVEVKVRNLCPFPVTYDVGQIQDSRFSEFTYTELLGGMWVCTQNRDMNCRIAAHQATPEVGMKIQDISLQNIQEMISDKYDLKDEEHQFTGAKKVVFLAGNNMMDVASVENLTRLCHEDDEVILKPHPITNDETLGFLGSRFGWHKIADKNLSGYRMMMDADYVWTTTASEFSMSATAMGKKVYNISNFFNETLGAYYPISRLLFLAHKVSVKEAQQCLVRLFSNNTGIITPFHEDLDDAILSYYKYSLDMRNQYAQFMDKSQKLIWDNKE